MNVQPKLRRILERIDSLSGRAPSILARALSSFTSAHAADAAAGTAYYALFSLFPLLLVLIVGGSFFLDTQRVYEQAVRLVTDMFPASGTLIEENLRTVMDLRGPVGAIGLVAALWSATGVFAVLARNVNRAWPNARARSFVASRWLALRSVGVLGALLALSLLSSAMRRFLPRLEIPLWGGISLYETWIWQVASRLVPWGFSFVLFFAVYSLVPNATVPVSAASWAALFAAIAWQLAYALFSWYVRSGLIEYELIYGSLGTIVALMFWIYLSSWIVFFGAHLSAAIASRRLIQRRDVIDAPPIPHRAKGGEDAI